MRADENNARSADPPRNPRPSSPSRLARRPVELGRTQLPGQYIQHRIDHAGLLAVEKRIGDVDIFRDDDARGNIAALVELEGARPQPAAPPRAGWPCARVSLRFSTSCFLSATRGAA